MILLDVMMDNNRIGDEIHNISALENDKAGGLGEVTAKLIKNGGRRRAHLHFTLYGRQTTSRTTGSVPGIVTLQKSYQQLQHL